MTDNALHTCQRALIVALRRGVPHPLNCRPSALEVMAPASLSYMFTCTGCARPRLRSPLMLLTLLSTMADDALRIL